MIQTAVGLVGREPEATPGSGGSARAVVEAALDAAMDAACGEAAAADLEEAVLDYLAGFGSRDQAMAAARPYPALRSALSALAPLRVRGLASPPSRSGRP